MRRCLEERQGSKVGPDAERPPCDVRGFAAGRGVRVWDRGRGPLRNGTGQKAEGLQEGESGRGR